MRKGIVVALWLAAAATMAAAAVINYHDPNPARPFLMAMGSICASGAAILFTASALRRRQS